VGAPIGRESAHQGTPLKFPPLLRKKSHLRVALALVLAEGYNFVGRTF
jgi:hypothetical protein